MNTSPSSSLRDAVGFMLGGLLAVAAAAMTLVMFYPIPNDRTWLPNYGRIALVMVAIVSFFCGGFVGRRAFRAYFWSDLLPSIIISYAVIGFMCAISDVDFRETAPTIGFVSVGIITSAIIMLPLGRYFPPKTTSHDG